MQFSTDQIFSLLYFSRVLQPGSKRYTMNNRDGYVYGQSVRGASEEFKSWVLDSEGYITEKLRNDKGGEFTFRHKSRIYPKEIHVNVSKPGRKKPVKKTVSIDQKQMVYYSEKYAAKQKVDREAMILRAKDLIKSPGKYDRITSKGSASYVLNLSFDKDTGEIADRKCLQLNKNTEASRR